MSARMLVIEREKSGQCEYVEAAFESVQFKTILKCKFEIVLNPNSKRSKLSPEMPLDQAFFVFSFIGMSIEVGRLHQRKQFVDALLRDLPHVIGIVHSGDVDAFYHGPDLVARIGKETQGIALFIGEARDQAGDQDLAGDHASVQFVHRELRLLLAGAVIWTTSAAGTPGGRIH